MHALTQCHDSLLGILAVIVLLLLGAAWAVCWAWGECDWK